MVGFIGPSGKHFTDSQRKAMFYPSFSSAPRVKLIKIGGPKSNRFALVSGSIVAAGLATKAIGAGAAAGAGGSSLAGAGFTGAAGLTAAGGIGSSLLGKGLRGASVPSGGGASVGTPITGSTVGGPEIDAAESIGETGRKTAHAVKKAVSSPLQAPGAVGSAGVAALGTATHVGKKVAITVADDVAPIIAGFAGGVLQTVGDPAFPEYEEFFGDGKYADENSVWPVDQYSRASGASINVDRMREVVKKQYPDADVNSEVVMLPPKEYMKTALSQNPGREREALSSNGFYSPSDDMTYLEIDTNRNNTTRAMLHEMVHDMSDDGVGRDDYNEGYADNTAKKLMVQELNIPEPVVNATLGYPKESKMIDKLIAVNGRKAVDRAFLKDHNLSNLEVRSAF